MDRRAVYIVGAGGVGRETLDAAIAAGIEIEAFIDEGGTGALVRGLRVIEPGDVDGAGDYVVGIAAPEARRRLSRALESRGLLPATIVHPRAVVAPETTMGVGCVLLAGAHVSSSVRLGDHCQVHYNATVGHDSVLDDRVTVYPGGNVSGSVHLCADATVGSNAVVLQGLTVGGGAFVGAGSVVTRDVPPGVVVVGSPARPLRHPRGAG